MSAVPTGQREGFNRAINGFRGLCVLLVFAYHVANSGLPGAADTVVSQAMVFFASSWRYGVELFFIISGFVIVGSLRRHRAVGSFLRDRCIRIFPAWIPVHLSLFFVGSAIGWGFLQNTDVSQRLVIFFANLVFLPPLVPLPPLHLASWSLSYEWLFYFMAAAAFWLYVRQAKPATDTPATPHAVGWLLWTALTLTLLYWLPRGLFFVPGAMVALGYTPWQRNSRSLRWPGLSLLVFLCAWRMVNINEAHPGAYLVGALLWSSTCVYVVVAFLAALHLFSCIAADNKSVRLLHGPPMQFLGTISYSFYLWHPLIMFGVKRVINAHLLPVAGHAVSTAVFAIVSLALGLVVSWLSYRLFEQAVGGALRHRWLRSNTAGHNPALTPLSRPVQSN